VVDDSSIIEGLKQRIAELEPRAAFGDQCYQDRCENAYVEQSVMQRREAENAALRKALMNLVDRLDGSYADGRKYEQALAAAREALKPQPTLKPLEQG
jgi:hypothetical protein